MGRWACAAFRGVGSRLGAVALVVVATAACSDGADRRVATGTTAKPSTQVLGEVIERDRPSATSTSVVGAAPTDDLTEAPTPPATVGTPAPSPTPTTHAPTTTVTTCHPDDDDCDGWWWTTAPGPNGPILLEVAISPVNPVDGEEVTVSVRASDPDAQVHEPFVCFRSEDSSYAQGYAADRPLGEGCSIAARCLEHQEGPVDPPAPASSAGEWQIHHTFPGAGSYVIDVAIDSSSRRCGPDPYASEAAESHPIVVRAT